jgi:hypothetical protein
MKKLLIFLCILAICGMAASAFAEGETRGVGYWRNHMGDYFSTDPNIDYGHRAAAKSYVLNPRTTLLEFLGKKGKKTIVEHAKRQLAAMLLNMVDGLHEGILLNQGELELIKQLNDDYTAEDTCVGDALVEIQDAIVAYDANDPILVAITEIAKDLADEINNRGAYQSTWNCEGRYLPL